MKSIVPLTVVICFIMIACNQPNNNRQMQAKIDSLQARLNDAYRPGLGEFMIGIQEHHAKLWFAGMNKNWQLADFEVHEIGETLDDVKKYCTDRPEIKSLGIIDPAVSTIKVAIDKQDIDKFKSGFIELTKDCNTCHKDNLHGFNIITIPTSPPVTNQDFKPAK
jgi:hypothetical protein